MHSGRFRLLSWALCLLAAVVFAGGCVKEQVWKVGEKAPAVSVLDLQDQTVKLSDFGGRPVILRFWATGCSACVEGMPKLDAMSREYREKGLVVLAINMGNSKPLVEAFAKGLKLTYPVLLDPALIAAKKYGVKAVPTTFFIDRSGVARSVVSGDLTKEVFESRVREVL